MLGEFPVIVENGTARLKKVVICAGSILQLKDGVKHVVDWGTCDSCSSLTNGQLVFQLNRLGLKILAEA